MSFDRRFFESLPRWTLLVGVFLAGHWQSPASAQDLAQSLEQSLMKVIEQAEPSVVSIAKIRVPLLDPSMILTRPLEPTQRPIEPEDPDFQPNSFGTGVLIAGSRPGERVVLTNYHVVLGGPVYSPRPVDVTGNFMRRGVRPARQADGVSTQLFVRFSDRRACYASIVAADPRSDLAVLALDLEDTHIDPADLKPLDLTGSTPIKKGQLVVMIGNPYALAYDGSASASWGMISNLTRRPLPWTDDMASRTRMNRLGNLMQIDGRLNLGTSGGPVLNLKGELIGITTSLAAVEGYEKSAGFAVPLDELTKRIVKALVAGNEVEYGMLGITLGNITPNRFRELNTGLKHPSAARVMDVSVDSPAERAGMQEGDVIISVGESPIYSDHDLMRVVGLYPPDSEVDLTAWRKELGRTLRLKVKLGKWPVKDDEEIIETSPRYPAWRGISVDYPTGRNRFIQNGDPYRRAVVVTGVEGSAQDAGLQPGKFIAEVNKVPVQTPAEFAEATKSLKGPVELRLLELNQVDNKLIRTMPRIIIPE